MNKLKIKKYSLLFVVVVVVLAALGYGGYLTMHANKTAETKTIIKDVATAPVIRNQDLYDAIKNENPAYSLPDTPSVTTSEGNSIQLELLFEMPRRGIYQYRNELYTYNMDTTMFTHITGGDAATFEIVPGGFSFDLYAKDKSQVYCRGELLVGADVKTFKKIPDWNQNSSKYLTADGKSYFFYEDKNHQYVFGDCSSTEVRDNPLR